MKLVVDTNILMAAILRDSFTRNLLLAPNLSLVTPEFAFQELSSLRKRILARANLSERDFDKFLTTLQSVITVVPEQTVLPYVPKAYAALKDIDLDDIDFLAAALAVDADGVWSDDKALKRQHLVRVYSTNELSTLVE